MIGCATGEPRFDVYVRTRTAVVTLVREVGLRTARVVALHHAETRRRPVYIRNCVTKAVETVPTPPIGA